MVRLSAPIVCPGLFYAVPAQDGSLFRLRIPGGVLTSHQAEAIANLATELGDGEVQVTNRANLQIRAVGAQIPAEVLKQLQRLGLAGPIPEVDHLRNIMASPTAGIDSQTVMDTRSLVSELDQYLSSHPALVGLPPKFSVGLDGGEAVSIGERPNDVCLTAVNHNSEVAFRLSLNISKGGQRLDLGVLLHPQAGSAIVAAIAEVYLHHEHQISDGTGKKPRLRQLLEHWSAEWYLEQVEKRIGYTLQRSPWGGCVRDDQGSAYLHLGIHPQRQKGLSYLGVGVPLGRLAADQLEGLAALAERYGNGTLRLTPWQNVLIPNVLDSRVECLQSAIALLNLSTLPAHPAGAIVACSGSGCKASATDTQAHARLLIDYLEQRVKLDRPLNVHLSGCPKSCAQHSPSDIALLGVDVDRYHVYVGTGDAAQPFGQQIGRSVPLTEIPGLIEQLVQIYQQNRWVEETFRAFVDRSIPQLQHSITSTSLNSTQL